MSSIIYTSRFSRHQKIWHWFPFPTYQPSVSAAVAWMMYGGFRPLPPRRRSSRCHWRRRSRSEWTRVRLPLTLLVILRGQGFRPRLLCGFDSVSTRYAREKRCRARASVTMETQVLCIKSSGKSLRLPWELREIFFIHSVGWGDFSLHEHLITRRVINQWSMKVMIQILQILFIYFIYISFGCSHSSSSSALKNLD